MRADTWKTVAFGLHEDESRELYAALTAGLGAWELEDPDMAFPFGPRSRVSEFIKDLLADHPVADEARRMAKVVILGEGWDEQNILPPRFQVKHQGERAIVTIDFVASERKPEVPNGR